MSTSEQAQGTAASGTGGASGASGASGERAAAGSPAQLGQPGDLELPAVTSEATDAVRGGMALPTDKQRQLARDT